MFNKQVMIDIFTKLLFQSKKSYDEFNAADGKIGDGDLGITILNGLEEINNNIEKFTDDLSTNFMLCSQAFVKKSGSSFGTLIAFSFMNISKNLKGPSWSPKKIRKIIEEKVITNNTTNVINENVEASEQSTKDSVRAIMLIRAFRIRGHLIANLDPLDIQKKMNILN